MQPRSVAQRIFIGRRLQNHSLFRRSSLLLRLVKLKSRSSPQSNSLNDVFSSHPPISNSLSRSLPPPHFA
ncbi:unnamed protein product, partial [Linum tenue]